MDSWKVVIVCLVCFATGFLAGMAKQKFNERE
ncbi:hypothetical protein UFOVP920_26 [uncultured Caudovirales phage]|uniref:Uncharacterized protein n=1 Tax=uncultured Caudovirales phage TaxID=2100421 RepID=A0A6J7XFC7_9CAUD|nr:hypothetical protein UFOVP920_26 [uncultured Caudovirales phage]CAB4200125.1 hypothetical protein UFOVP1345_26 [uncultured Caudovirales phage]CAB5228756.1 hypothetical protein UFOVP1542_26 [uncultured Caudovirales phage]